MARKVLVAILLCAAAILVVALVRVSQPPQDPPVKPIVVASAGASGPVDASSLLGTWRIDTDATWEHLGKRAAFATQMAGMTENQVGKFKSKWRTTVDADYCQFTGHKMIWSGNAKHHEMSYTITATTGNVLTANCVNESGQRSQCTFTIIGNRLTITDSTSSNSDWDIVYIHVL